MEPASLVPELYVSDMQKSLQFYCNIVGFAVEFERPEDRFAYLSFHGSHIMLEQDTPGASPWKVEPIDHPRGRGLNLSIQCPDAESLARRIVDAGLSLRKPVEEKWYRNHDLYHGERNFLVLDPDGYLLRFTQSLGMKSKDQIGVV